LENVAVGGSPLPNWMMPSSAKHILETSGVGTLDKTDDSEPSLLPTALDDRGDFAVALKLMSGSVSVATGSEGRNESWRQCGTRTGQRIEDDEIGMRLCKFLNL
jgi:hypothetical protein